MNISVVNGAPTRFSLNAWTAPTLAAATLSRHHRLCRGLAIMTDAKMHIRVIGVSGGTADQDETCAQADINAVEDALK
jgi:uncharacterized protein GlcG (DUF336 family)